MYLVRRERKWELEDGARRRRDKSDLFFFLTQFFKLWIPVVTAALGFGLKVYSEDMRNPCPILSKTRISGNKYINIQLRHQMLTKATQWVGFYSRPSFCSVFVHVFHHGVLGSKGDQDLPLQHQWGCEASRASCTEPRCVRLTVSPPETARKLRRVGYLEEETWQGWFLNRLKGFVLLSISCWKVTA